MTMQLAEEKREHPRMGLNRLVRVKTHAGKSMQLIGINYSLTGMALNSKTPFQAGEFIELDFRLNEQDQQEFNMTAEVVQNFKHGNMYVTGVRFLAELEYANTSQMAN